MQPCDCGVPSWAAVCRGTPFCVGMVWKPMAAPVATATTTVTTTTTTYAMGVNYAAVPAGSIVINKNGGTYYLNGNTWFQPAFGANGVYYRVVSAP